MTDTDINHLNFDQNKLGNHTLIHKMTIIHMTSLLVSC